MAEESILILGLGSPLRGDDVIGSMVIEALTSHQLPAGTHLVDAGTAGLEIVLELQGHSTVLVVDCAKFGGRPGDVRRFDLLRHDLANVNWSAGHAHGLAAAIELARALGISPNRFCLFAIEPETLEHNVGPSDAVRGALTRVVRQILDEVRA